MQKAWILGLMLTLSLFNLGCKRELKDPDKEVKYTGPLIENTDVTTLYSDSAKVLIKLKAPVQQEFENGDGVFPKGLYIEFYDKAGQISSTLRANYGKQQKNKNLYLVRGHVVFVNRLKKEKLETEELYWDKSKQKIYTDKFVTITTPERMITGTGLEADQDFSNYRILNPTGILDLTEE
jgi:LPS export ABC transporter protein LptC